MDLEVIKDYVALSGNDKNPLKVCTDLMEDSSVCMQSLVGLDDGSTLLKGMDKPHSLNPLSGLDVGSGYDGVNQAQRKYGGPGGGKWKRAARQGSLVGANSFIGMVGCNRHNLLADDVFNSETKNQET
ncbi:hypothetical protein Q3G72_008167 [Acer saccharum]|nr:hypothetical protein Q3G72_008167 [Acer saccharum]